LEGGDNFSNLVKNPVNRFINGLESNKAFTFYKFNILNVQTLELFIVGNILTRSLIPV